MTSPFPTILPNKVLPFTRAAVDMGTACRSHALIQSQDERDQRPILYGLQEKNSLSDTRRYMELAPQYSCRQIVATSRFMSGNFGVKKGGLKNEYNIRLF